MSNGIKILIISYMYSSSTNEVSGIFVYQQVKELKKRGCKIKVISPVPLTPFPVKYLSKKWKKYSRVPPKTIRDGIGIYRPRYLEFPRVIFFASSGKRMYRGIKKLVENIYKDFKFDLIHSHVALPDGYAGMELAKKYNKPLVVTIHGTDFQQTIYRNKKCREAITEVINYSKKTIVVSNKLKKIGEKELKIILNKVVVIPNGIDPDDIYKGQSNFLEQYKDKKIILSVSHLEKIKGIDFNLRAVAKLKEKYSNLIYLIIGDGQERKNLENLASKLNLQNHIEFLGQLPHQKAMEYISICDIFSLPSWEEGFGIVYLEAMAHGKPVIACERQGIGDVIQDEKTGLLVKARDTNDLAKAIESLLDSPGLTKEIGKKAKKLTLENYTWAQAVQKLIKIYKEILKNEK